MLQEGQIIWGTHQMSNAPNFGTLVQSSALAEATTDSLSILFSKDPEKLADIDLDRLIEELRAKRVKWAAGEAAKPESGRGKKPVASKAASLVSAASAEDLGL